MPTWKRVLLIGFTCQKIDELVESKPDQLDSHLEQILLESRLAAINGTFAEQVENILPISKVKHHQAMIVYHMTQMRKDVSTNEQGRFQNKTFLRCIDLAGDGYNKTLEQANDLEALVSYSSFEKFDASKPHILENYLINLYYSSLFPMGNKLKLHDQWSDMTIRYALVRFYLKGIAESLGSQFDEFSCIDLIYSFTKENDHNSVFLPRMHHLLKSEGLDGTAALAILIR
jgi:hypothetical protein